MGSFVAAMIVFPPQAYDDRTQMRYTRWVLLLSLVQLLFMLTVTRREKKLSVWAVRTLIFTSVVLNVGFFAVVRAIYSDVSFDVNSVAEGRSRLAFLIALMPVMTYHVMTDISQASKAG